jgi:hypothetical protein
MHHVMHGVLAYQGKVVQPKPAERACVSDIALIFLFQGQEFGCMRALIRLIYLPPTLHQNLPNRLIGTRIAPLCCTCQFSSRGVVSWPLQVCTPYCRVGFSEDCIVVPACY